MFVAMFWALFLRPAEAGRYSGLEPKRYSPNGNSSELQVQFEKRQMDGIAAGVDRLRHEPAGCVSYVTADANVRGEREIRADVVQDAERRLAVRRPARVAESRGLKRAAARVPEI